MSSTPSYQDIHNDSPAKQSPQSSRLGLFATATISTVMICSVSVSNTIFPAVITILLSCPNSAQNLAPKSLTALCLPHVRKKRGRRISEPLPNLPPQPRPQ